MGQGIRGIMAVATLSASLGGCQSLGQIAGTAPGGPDAPNAVPTTSLPAPVVPEAVPVRAAGLLAGLDAAQLLGLWGEPTVRRREAGAELWTYGKPRAGCTVLVYLYPGTGGAMAVARSEALPGGTDRAAVAACAQANGLSPGGQS